jgi:cytochrome P450
MSVRHDLRVTDPSTGPAEIDPAKLLSGGDAEVRRCAAQHWWAQGIGADGRPMPVVLGWEANRETLNDRRLSPRSFVDDMVASGVSVATALQTAPLFSRHGAEHRHLRAVLSTAFTPRKVEQLRPAARSIAERLTDEIASAGGECEFVSTFAEPLPPEVFAILFGLPVEDRDRMARWAAAIARAFTPGMAPDDVDVVERAAAEMRAYGEERISASRATPGDDLVTRLVEAEVDGERLSDDDVIAMITGFVFAGAETTRRQLTAAIVVLAEHPSSWERLADDPSLLPTAVDEILRYHPIVGGLTRRAEEPFDREDLAVEPGGRMLLSFTTANRDPERFERPDEYVVDRADAHAHVTFGWGPHLCVGAGLARLELAEALGALTARFGPPVVEEPGPVTFGAPDWLRVRFPARGRS